MINFHDMKDLKWICEQANLPIQVKGKKVTITYPNLTAEYVNDLYGIDDAYKDVEIFIELMAEEEACSGD